MKIERVILAKIIAVVVGFLSLIMLADSLSDVYKAYQTSKWSVVKGDLIKGLITSYTNPRTGQVYEIELVYKYELNGKVCKGDKLKIGSYSTMDRLEAEEIIRKLRSQDSMPVYVNPENDDDSVLLVGIDRQNIISVIVFFVVTLICASGWLMLKSGERGRSEK